MNEWFEVRESKIQGKGCFARQDIPKGTRIVEYVGEVITNEEADNRYDDESMDRHHTFLFTLDEKHCVDGAIGGNEAIYINHSCEPNCETEIEEDRIFVYALSDIKAGEELFYDYAYEREEDETDEEARKTYPCYCGSKNCRGTIMAPREENEKKDEGSDEEE